MTARVGMVGAVPVCPPERPRSGVSIPKIHALCTGMNDGCALAGRHGRAHRHRPYPSPSYFSVQSAHNRWPHLPRSYKTIHHLEMNERQNITIHHCVPTNSRIKSVSTRNVNVGRFDTSTSPTYLRAADNELTRSIRLTSLCKRIPKLCFES